MLASASTWQGCGPCVMSQVGIEAPALDMRTWPTATASIFILTYMVLRYYSFLEIVVSSFSFESLFILKTKFGTWMFSFVYFSYYCVFDLVEIHLTHFTTLIEKQLVHFFMHSKATICT